MMHLRLPWFIEVLFEEGDFRSESINSVKSDIDEGDGGTFHNIKKWTYDVQIFMQEYPRWKYVTVR